MAESKKPDDQSTRVFKLLTEEIMKEGSRTVTDGRGNTYLIMERQLPRRGGLRPGETFSAWLRRTLPPGEGIDTDGIRNPEGSQHRDGWILDMLDEEDDLAHPRSPSAIAKRETP